MVASQDTEPRSRAGAILCALLLLIAVLISHPVADTGINDDWSYVRSAKLMAETGRFMYVGWASAMLGWMLPIGALFVKMFGFSFTAVRGAAVLIGATTAYFFQRCFARAGLNAWNATVLTLTFVLAPIYLPLATTYMTDLPGVLATLVCLYCCLRALQTPSDRVSGLWLLLACFLTAIGGTARQTAWLALFFMIPAATWLVRKRHLPWLALGLGWLASLAFTVASLRWFSHQPYSLREAVVAGYLDRDIIYAFLESVTRATLDSALLLLPLTIAFVRVAGLHAKEARRWYIAAAAFTVLGLAFVVYRHTFLSWLAPFDGNYWTENGVADTTEIGLRKPMLGIGVRLLLSAVTWVCALCAVGYFVAMKRRSGLTFSSRAGIAERWKQLGILLLPYSVAYSLLLVHRALFSHIFDRYMLALLFVPALFLVLYYQEHVATRLPRSSVALVVIFGLFSTAANHDLFAMERARVQAGEELVQAGVPRTEFYGGWEYDGWTQLDRYGFANSGYMNTPQGFVARPPILLRMTTKPCNYWAARIAAAIQPKYAVSYDSVSCGGPTQFPPVSYKSWLPPYGSKLYIQRVIEHVY